MELEGLWDDLLSKWRMRKRPASAGEANAKARRTKTGRHARGFLRRRRGAQRRQSAALLTLRDQMLLPRTFREAAVQRIGVCASMC